MRFKKLFVILIGGLMLPPIALAGCKTTNPNNGNIFNNDTIVEDDEDIIVEGIDKYGTLNDLYSWIDELNVEEIVEIRYEHAYIGVAPGMLRDIFYSTNSLDIENTYRLLFSPLTAITADEGKIEGGGYVKYDFSTANNATYSIIVSNNTVRINNQYFKFVDNFYYKFKYSELDCHSFITYDIPACEEYEVYTYAEESVKIGNFSGLSEFEFCIYDGLIKNTPKFYLRSSVAVNLLILSNNQFMIEGEDNTTIYQITGEKDFSFLFTE